MMVESGAEGQSTLPDAPLPLVEPTVQHQSFTSVVGCSLLILLVALACAVVTTLSTLPLIEGWYESLLYLDKHGIKPYVDAEFLLPPMILVLYRFYDSVSHSDFAVTKLLGLALTFVNCALLYAWLRRQVSNAAAILSSVITFVIITTEPAYATADYHDLVQFFVTIVVIVSLAPQSFREKPSAVKVLVLDLILGASAQALFLTKQNVGLGVALTIGLLIVRRRGRGFVLAAARVAVYVSAFLAAGFFIVKVAGIQQSYFQFIRFIISIQSKGSPFFAATRLLHDPNNNAELLPGFELAVLATFLYLVGRYLWQLRTAGLATVTSILGSRFPERYVKIARVVIVALVTIYVFKAALEQMIAQDPIWLYNFWPTIFTVAAFLIDIFSTLATVFGGSGIPWIRSSSWLAVTRVTLFAAIFYSNSLTASMTVLPLFVMFAFYAAFGIDVAFRFASRQQVIWLRAFLFGAATMVGIFVFRLELSKFQAPFSWWGLQEPPVFDSSVSVNLPYMKGLRLEPARASMLTKFVSEIDAKTGPDEPIFTYPDIPVFYMLANRLPMTKTYIQWFDFSTNASLIPDFTKVSQSPPKIIVQLSNPIWVDQGHEALLGRDLPQTAFSRYLNCMIAANAFSTISQYYYSKSDAVGGTFRLRAERPLSGNEVNEVAAATRDYVPAAALATGALGLDDSGIPLSQVEASQDKDSRQYGGVVVVGKGEQLTGLLRELKSATNLTLQPYEDQYIVRLLERQPSWESKGAVCHSTLLQSLKTY
jgi:hypothetical protein